MQESLALSIGLPIALVIIMLGLGLSLRIADFVRCLARPRPVVIGLACQILILPALCFGLVSLAGLPPAISVGMMLLAASPGGPSAAIYTHLARGDVALSLTLAAATSLIAPLSLPVIANLSLVAFYGAGSPVRLEVHQVLQIFAIAIAPALAGVFIHSRYPAIARRLDRPVKLMATLFLTAVVLGALIGQWRLLIEWGPSVGVLAVAFSLLSLFVGFVVPRLLRVERAQATGISMSIGVHNAALVMTIAMSERLLGNPEMAIPPAAYGLVTYIACGVFVWLLNRRRNEQASP